MKYYVDSGELKIVLEASSPLDACAKAIYQNIGMAKNIEDVCSFEQKFIVSEKGSLSQTEALTNEAPKCIIGRIFRLVISGAN